MQNQDLLAIENDAQEMTGKNCTAGFKQGKTNEFCAIAFTETGEIIGHAIFENDACLTITTHISKKYAL